jgi:Mn2+/Fe2+ NRAMP family transporter
MTTESEALKLLAAREEALRALDRSRVIRARRSGRAWLVLLLLAGPGMLTMLGENDGPSMLSYVTTGALYGAGWFVPFIVATFAMAYVVQEATTRIGIATKRGHAELIFNRFGAGWGYFAMLDLSIGNVLTLVTEFIAIRTGAAFLGVPPWIAVAAAVSVVGMAFATRRYFTWERFAMLLAAANLVFIPIALHAHPSLHAVEQSLAFGGAFPGGLNGTLLTIVLANVGATVTPWMIFFQQSAVVDKGLTPADLRHARADTAIGAALAASVAVATVAIGAVLLSHHVSVASLRDGADFATALQPFIGRPMATLFAVGLIEAGLTAAVTISASSAYVAGEVLHGGRSLNRSFKDGRAFYAAAIGSVAVAAAVVLIPHAPLLTIALTVNVMAALLMAPALIFVLLLANDRNIMGELANTPAANALGGVVMVLISAMGVLYGALAVFPHILGT